MEKKSRRTLWAYLLIAIIIMILGILIPPSVYMSNEEARKTGCRENLRQIGMALTLYAQDNQDWSPPMYGNDYPDNPYTEVDETTDQTKAIHKANTDFRVAPFTLTQYSLSNSRIYTMSGPNLVVSTGPMSGAGWAPTKVISGLGLLLSGGYLTKHGVPAILTCPSWPIGIDRKRLTYRLENFFLPDEQEPFWTLFEVPAADIGQTGTRNAASNGNSLQDFGNFDTSWVSADDFILSGYWLRMRDDGSNYNSLKIVPNSGKGIVSDLIAGFHSSLNSFNEPVKEPALLDFNNNRFKNVPFITNHLDSYNVLYADGSCRGVTDNGEIRRVILDCQIRGANSTLGIIEYLNGATLSPFFGGTPNQSEDCIMISKEVFKIFDADYEEEK